jgi:antitoxin PrlF
MTTATISSKGQITIPVTVREALQVMAGDRVEFVEVQTGRFEFFAATRSVKELKGMFGKNQSKSKSKVTIAQMNQAIAARGAMARSS